MAILSRCIYKTKTKFRTDKWTKEMQKLNHALLQYLNLNIVYHVEGFKEMLPKSSEHIYYLPTKNMLDYILVRLQGIIKIMCRAIECAKCAAFYMEQRIALGQFWKIVFICFAVVSRLRILAIEIMKFSWRFFIVAVSYSSLLKNTGPQWLSSNYVFSRNIEDYVCNSCYNEGFNAILKTQDRTSNIFDYLQSPSTDTIDNSADNNNKSELETPSSMLTTTISKKAKKKHISTALDKNKVNYDVKNKEEKSNLIDDLKTVKDLKKFLHAEDRARESSSIKSCALHNLDGLQWNMMRKKLKALLLKAVRSKNESKTNKILENMRKIIQDCLSS